MTSDEAIGRSVREYREKSERAAALRSQLRRIGEALSNFGLALQQKPELIQLGNASFDLGSLRQVVHPSDEIHQFDALKVSELLSELRQIEQSRSQLQRELKALNIPIANGS